MVRAQHPLLSCHSLTIGYSSNTLIQSIDLEVTMKESWALIGPNGSGKTSLIYTVLGLIKPLGGSCAKNAVINYIPQKPTLHLHFPASAYDVVYSGFSYSMGMVPYSKNEKDRKIKLILEMLNLDKVQNLPYRHLSVGQIQKTLIGRALVSDCQLLIMDEPTASLDMTSSKELLDLIKRLNRDIDLSILIVSHLLHDIHGLCNKAALIDPYSKRLITGTIEEIQANPLFIELFN